MSSKPNYAQHLGASPAGRPAHPSFGESVEVYSGAPAVKAPSAIFSAATGTIIPIPITSPRYASFDYLRVVAVIGIVWFHTVDTWDSMIGYAGLFAFGQLSAFLACTSSFHYTFKEYARKRFQRLLVPWVFWSIFYIATRAIRDLAIGQPITEKLQISMLLSGGQNVLWYLSYIFACSIFIYGLVKLTARIPKGIVTLVLLLSATVLFLETPSIRAALPATFPIPQWITLFPAILIGCACGLVCEVKDTERKGLTKASLLALTLIPLVALVRCTAAYESEAVSFLIGTILFIFCLLVPLPISPRFQRLSALTLGVYVLHPCISHGPGIILHNAPAQVSAALIVIAAFFAAALMKRSRFLKDFI